MLRPPAPPFAVPAVAFRFPALAALAGRLPVGSGREAALAALLVARLAAGMVPDARLARPIRAQRAAAARQWLPSMCPDVRVRAACTTLAAATAEDDPSPVGKALVRVIEVTAPHLDSAARSELSALARSLG